MVRIAGSVKVENSLIVPTGELFSSVVRRINGKSAKRIRGTERSPPTKTDPTPSNVPKNERRLPRDEGDAADFGVAPSKSFAHPHIENSPQSTCVANSHSICCVCKCL